MAIERTYTVPLRKEWQKVPRYRRAKRAVNAVKTFLIKHMKADKENVKIGKYLNLEIWKHGIKNPPSKIRINVKKDDKGIVTAELVGAPEERKKVVKGKKVALKKAEKKAEAKSVKKEETKKEVKEEEKKAEAKPAEKKEEKKEEKAEPKKEEKPAEKKKVVKKEAKKEQKPEKKPSEKP